MAADLGKLNWVFGSLVAILAAVAGFTMYQNRNMPVIRDAPAAAQLPDNHPPVDAANRLAMLEDMSKAQPQNADLKAQVGNAYYDMGQYPKAAEAYEESLRLQPRNAPVETDLATSYHFLGQSDKALEIFDRVLEYKPGFAQALFNKGVVLQAKSDGRGAVAAWELLLEANPDFPQKADLEQRIRQLKASAR